MHQCSVQDGSSLLVHFSEPEQPICLLGWLISHPDRSWILGSPMAILRVSDAASQIVMFVMGAADMATQIQIP